MNASESPMFQYSIISLKLNDSDFETAAQTWSNIEDDPFDHDSVLEAVIDGMDNSEEYEEEETVEEVGVELED